MTDYAISISWMVISFIAFVTDILAICVIAHYFPYFHGTDVTLTSLLVAMAGNALLVVPIPAYMDLTSEKWGPELCTGYAWCVLTFRVAQIFGLAIMAIHWSTMLKLAAEKKKYFSTKFLKISIVFVWLFSAFFGLLPVIGAVNQDYNEQSTCKFLGFNLGSGYGLFFIIANISALIVSCICTTDASLLIKNMKAVARTKYQAERFHLPDKRADIPGQAVSTGSERYLRLNFAWNLSRFVLVFTIASFCINHLPYAIIQGVQLFSRPDRKLLETITIYLVGVEALLLPQTLWLFSRRYKHALTYQWKVHVLRRKDVEEDGVYHPYACMLQSYAREREKMAAHSRPTSRGPYSQSGTIRSTTSDVHGAGHNRSNGRVHVSSVADEMIRIDQENQQRRAQVVARNMNGSVINGDIVVEDHPYRYQERSVDVEIDTRPRSRPRSTELRETTPVSIPDSNRRTSEASSGSNSQTSNQGAFFSPRTDIKRSSSGQSRKDWKENIKKKHLPSIFINEAFDTEDNKSQAGKKGVPNKTSEIHTIYKGDKNQEVAGPLHFYMSSDYHPDYLIDSLPRHRLAQDSFDNESEDTGEVYRDEDILEVLGDASDALNDERYGTRNASVSQFNKVRDIRPYMSTFKSPESGDGSPANAKHETKGGAYATYENLSAQSLNGYDASESFTDEFSDGYHSFKGMKRLSHNENDKDSQLSKFLVFASERSAIKGSPGGSPDFSSLGRSRNGTPYKSIQGVEMATTSFGKSDNVSRTKKWERNSFNGNASSYITAKNKNDNSFGLVSKNEQTRVAGYNESIELRNTVEPKSLSTFSYLGSSNIHPKSKEFQQELSNCISKHDSITEQINKNSDENESEVVERITIDDENASSGSNSSVTLSPYRGEVRKPWMIDFELHEDQSQLEEPLVQESDTDTLRESHDSSELRTSFGFDFKQNSHSELSTPVSFLFDEETERGFEEALDVHQGSSVSVYGGVGLCFESIKEEPEDIVSSSGSNPFLDNISNPDEFRTQAVVSRGSRSDSRTSNSSSASLSDNNPFGVTPSRAPRKKGYKKGDSSTTRVIVTDVDAEFADSGFGSAIDKYNTSSESSCQQDLPTSRENTVSPWLDDDLHARNADLSFESNFCENQSPRATGSDVINKPPRASNINRNKVGVESQCTGSIKGKHLFESRKPVNKSLIDLKHQTRQPPVRVKSLDSESPNLHRKLPRRAGSFDGTRSDFKPAYF